MASPCDEGVHCTCYPNSACCYCQSAPHDVMADLESAFGVVKEDHERLMEQTNARRRITDMLRDLRASLAVAGTVMPFMNELQREAYLWGIITVLVRVVEEMSRQMEASDA